MPCIVEAASSRQHGIINHGVHAHRGSRLFWW
jgi:hypothetical protein